jgi:hypothetical protein
LAHADPAIGRAFARADWLCPSSYCAGTASTIASLRRRSGPEALAVAQLGTTTNIGGYGSRTGARCCSFVRNDVDGVVSRFNFPRAKSQTATREAFRVTSPRFSGRGRPAKRKRSRAGEGLSPRAQQSVEIAPLPARAGRGRRESAAPPSRGSMRPSFAKQSRLTKRNQGAGKTGCPVHPQPRVRW